jgi:hypothetical protein
MGKQKWVKIFWKGAPIRNLQLGILKQRRRYNVTMDLEK